MVWQGFHFCLVILMSRFYFVVPPTSYVYMMAYGVERRVVSLALHFLTEKHVDNFYSNLAMKLRGYNVNYVL